MSRKITLFLILIFLAMIPVLSKTHPTTNQGDSIKKRQKEKLSQMEKIRKELPPLAILPPALQLSPAETVEWKKFKFRLDQLSGEIDNFLRKWKPRIIRIHPTPGPVPGLGNSSDPTSELMKLTKEMQEMQNDSEHIAELLEMAAKMNPPNPTALFLMVFKERAKILRNMINSVR